MTINTINRAAVLAVALCAAYCASAASHELGELVGKYTDSQTITASDKLDKDTKEYRDVMDVLEKNIDSKLLDEIADEISIYAHYYSITAGQSGILGVTKSSGLSTIPSTLKDVSKSDLKNPLKLAKILKSARKVLDSGNLYFCMVSNDGSTKIYDVGDVMPVKGGAAYDIVVFGLKGSCVGKKFSFTINLRDAECELTVDPNGGYLSGEVFGEGDKSADPTTVTVKYNTTKNNTIGKATLVGNAFAGWFTKKSGGTKVFAANGKYVPGAFWTSEGKWSYVGDVKVYAQWTVNKSTVKFNANGGTGTMKDVVRSYNDGKALPANSFKRTNYTFQGWSTTKGGKVKYTNKQKVELASKDGATITLYAVWKVNTCKVAFNANGGTGMMKPLTINAGAAKALTKNAFKKTGYTFKGWAKTKAGRVAYKDKAKVKIIATKNGVTVTLYAVWVANTYKIAFDKNGGKGTAPKTISATYGKEVKLPACKLTRANYTFQGWSTDKKATIAKYKDKAKVKNVAASGTVKLYAVWARNQYKLILDPNGATGAKTTKTVNCGDKVKLANSFKRDGYIFKGWATSKNGKVVYADGKSVKDLAKKSKSVTLYAVWSLPDWAFGEFNGWVDCVYGIPSQVYSGPAIATVSSRGALSAKAEIENPGGGTVSTSFSASKFSEYYPSVTMDKFAEMCNDEDDFYGLMESLEDRNLYASKFSVYIYRNVTLKMPIDAMTHIVDIIVVSYPYDGKGGRMGMMLFRMSDNLSALMTQNLFKSKHLAYPQFSGTPVKKVPKSVVDWNTDAADAALSGLTDFDFSFASDGSVKITAYSGTVKKWTTTSRLMIYCYADGAFTGQIDLVTKEGCACWVHLELKPGKDGKVSADEITIFEDDD